MVYSCCEKSYNELFVKSRSEFISELSGFCCAAEIRFARDMVHSVVKRKIGNNNLGRLTERRPGANVKDNLLKDIYNLYLLGQGSIESLPKNMIKSDTKFQHQEVQHNSCLSNTLVASKAEVEAVKTIY